MSETSQNMIEESAKKMYSGKFPCPYIYNIYIKNSCYCTCKAMLLKVSRK